MINVHVLNANNIVTLEGGGKLPIKSSQGLTFYNTNELLCVTVGACIGRQLVFWGLSNKVDLDTFESLGVTMDNGIIEIHIQHPKNIDVKELTYTIEHCEVSRKISIPIKVIAKENTTSNKELKKRGESKDCCGKPEKN